MEFYGQNRPVRDTYIIMCIAFVCVARAWIFFWLIVGKTTNRNINGISNCHPDFSISSFNSYSPLPDRKPSRNLKCHVAAYLFLINQINTRICISLTFFFSF